MRSTKLNNHQISTWFLELTEFYFDALLRLRHPSLVVLKSRRSHVGSYVQLVYISEWNDGACDRFWTCRICRAKTWSQKRIANQSNTVSLLCYHRRTLRFNSLTTLYSGYICERMIESKWKDGKCIWETFSNSTNRREKDSTEYDQLWSQTTKSIPCA